MSKGKSQPKPVDTLRLETQKAATAAAPLSANTQKVDEYNNKLWDMMTGKTQFNVNNLPNSNILMPMYEAAKQRADSRIGTGLNYGEGGNADHIAAIREQNDNERAMNAAGMLERNVNATFAPVLPQMMALGQADENARAQNYARVYGLYNTEAGLQAQRDAKPKWYASLLSGGIGALGQWGLSGFKMPGSSSGANLPSSSLMHESMHDFYN